MNRAIRWMVFAGLSFFEVAAHAQAPGVPLTMDSGLYLGAGGGRAKASFECVGSPCAKRDEAWSVFAGYQFNRHVAVELGYADLGEATFTGILLGAPVTVVMQTKVVELVGVGMLPITESFTFYGKAGVFRYDSDGTSSGAFVGTGSGDGTEFTLAGGVQYAFTRNVAVRFELQTYSEVDSGIAGVEKQDITVWRLGGRVKF